MIPYLSRNCTLSILTPHQQGAVDWAVDEIKCGAHELAVTGLAGTGKSTLISSLRDALSEDGHTVRVGTPTHRAAVVLRQKGIDDANTIHAHALSPQFTPEYEEAFCWLADESGHFGETPPLIAEQLTALERPSGADFQLWELAHKYTPGRALGSIGIHGRNHLVGFAPKPRTNAILVVDEASMVGRQLLAMCSAAFRTVILVGDPGQLPPVRDISVLQEIKSFHLSAIHRQAADSTILQLAYDARRGSPFWKRGLARYGPHCFEIDAVPAKEFLTAPLLTWRNRTRLNCTKMIREALGYPPNQLVRGEPLVCRGTDSSLRVDGFYNNAQFRVGEVLQDDHREVALLDDATGEKCEALVHIEEFDGDNVEVDAIPFRFGYCLTAHTAQGGEWPTVYISRPDLVSYAGYTWHQGKLDELARWAYTAITRGKERVGLLTQHAFAKEVRDES